MRFYCWQRCACNYLPTRDNLTTGMWLDPRVRTWRFLSTHVLIQQNDGSVTYHQTGAQSSEGLVLPAQVGTTPHAGTCGTNGTQFCPSLWPENSLGPISQMQAPPNSTEIVKPKTAGSNNLTVCGSYCTGPQDCGSSNALESCSCAMPSPADTRTLGLDPVAPVAVCLVLALTTISSPLNGRGVPQYVDERGLAYQCRCNSTYTSNECCGSSLARTGASSLYS